MAKVNFNMRLCSREFRKGFECALGFFDGVPQGKEHISFCYKGITMIGIDFSDGGDEDNVTYIIRRGKIVPSATGVER